MLLVYKKEQLMWTIVKGLVVLLACGACYTCCIDQSQTNKIPSNIEKLRDNIQSLKSGKFLSDTTRVSSPIYATLSSRELDSGTGGEGGTPLFSLAFSVKKKVNLIVARISSSVKTFVASKRNHYNILSRKIDSKKSYNVTFSNLAESLGYIVKKKTHGVEKNMSLIGTSRNDIWHSPAVLYIATPFDVGVYSNLTGFG